MFFFLSISLFFEGVPKEWMKRDAASYPLKNGSLHLTRHFCNLFFFFFFLSFFFFFFLCSHHAPRPFLLTWLFARGGHQFYPIDLVQTTHLILLPLLFCIASLDRLVHSMLLSISLVGSVWYVCGSRLNDWQSISFFYTLPVKFSLMPRRG
ncbi:hypothetical protein BDV18DRAFT_17237 [Aspergillus unguis]